RKPLSPKEAVLVGAKTIRFTVDEDDYRLTFDCFSDGYGVAMLREPPTVVEFPDLDQVEILKHRREVHRMLLTGEHPISHLLTEHVEGLRKIAGKQRRETATTE